MTLPASGQLSFADINAELTFESTAAIGLGDMDVRNLAGVGMTDITVADLYGKTFVPPPVELQVYFGLSTTRIITEALITSLPAFPLLDVVLPYTFTLTSGPGQYQYWASPVSLGPIKFYDTESFFIGGWDGAYNDMSQVGPVKRVINAVEYYVYRSDFANLGPCFWEARHEANPYYPV